MPSSEPKVMKNVENTDARLIVLSIVLAAGIFLVDLALPLGVAAGVPYVALVLVSLWSPQRRFILIMAATGSLLTILGFLLSQSGGELWKVLANRFLALFAIWATTILSLQRRRADDTVRESEVKIRTVMETAINAIITITERGTVEAFNPAAEKMFGYAASEVIGKNVNILMPEPHHSEHDRYLKNYLHSSDKKMIGNQREVAGKRKDGSTFPMELTISEMRIGSKRMFTEMGWDITERKRSEQLMTRFGRILDNSLNEIYIFDAETMHFVQVNEGARQNLDYTMEEMKRLTPLDLKPEHTVESFNSLVQPLKNGKKEYILFDTKHKRKNGSLYPVEVRLQLSSTETPPVYVAIIHNITERKQAEETIRKKGKQLEEANKELEEFNYVASHDLQEPLRTLTSYCTFLKKDVGENLSEKARQDIDFITDAAKRMQKLIQDLLELSRAGRWEPKMEAVDLSQCVKAVSSDLDTRIRECNGTVKWDTLPTVTGDCSHLSRVMQNLVGNALKFHKKEPPVVNVSAQRENGMWAITIADNGIGMEPQYLDQIFMPFKRLHGKGTFEGSGIGLSVCKKIVERHGGEIKAESELGKGSSFKFTLKAWNSKS
ncbi:MAG: hypothetical protein IEMM0002_0357 [bacterium]|nr:MAG: hypothetical protein IEMM0002_0357 [bacterium]